MKQILIFALISLITFFIINLLPQSVLNDALKQCVSNKDTILCDKNKQIRQQLKQLYNNVYLVSRNAGQNQNKYEFVAVKERKAKNLNKIQTKSEEQIQHLVVQLPTQIQSSEKEIETTEEIRTNQQQQQHEKQSYQNIEIEIQNSQPTQTAEQISLSTQNTQKQQIQITSFINDVNQQFAEIGNIFQQNIPQVAQNTQQSTQQTNYQQKTEQIRVHQQQLNNQMIAEKVEQNISQHPQANHQVHHPEDEGIVINAQPIVIQADTSQVLHLQQIVNQQTNQNIEEMANIQQHETIPSSQINDQVINIDHQQVPNLEHNEEQSILIENQINQQQIHDQTQHQISHQHPIQQQIQIQQQQLPEQQTGQIQNNKQVQQTQPQFQQQPNNHQQAQNNMQEWKIEDDIQMEQNIF